MLGNPGQVSILCYNINLPALGCVFSNQAIVCHGCVKSFRCVESQSTCLRNLQGRFEAWAYHVQLLAFFKLCYFFLYLINISSVFDRAQKETEG